MFAVSSHYKEDYMLFQWGAGIVALLIGVVLFFPNLLGVSLAYFSMNILCRANPAAVYIGFFVPILLAYIVDIEDWHMRVFGITNALYVILGYVLGFGKFINGVGYSGFIDYSSLNACLMALSLPFFFSKDRIYLVSMAIILVAIVLSKSSVPYGVIFAMLLLGQIKYFWMLLGPVVLGLAVEGGTLFDNSHRFEAYRLFMKSWASYGYYWTGLGPQSFVANAPHIQKMHDFMPKGDGTYWIFVSLHSDWLQVIFEYGILGVFFAGLLFLCALYRLKGPWYYVTVGLGAAAVFNMPLRHFITAFLSAYSLKRAYQESKCLPR